MATIIRDEKLKRIGNSVRPDAKRRVVLPIDLVQEDIIYHVYANSIGQIILDPQVTIPASEAWIFEDKSIIAKIDKGMAEKEVINRGSFAKYVKDEA